MSQHEPGHDVTPEMARAPPAVGKSVDKGTGRLTFLLAAGLIAILAVVFAFFGWAITSNSYVPNVVSGWERY